MNDEERTAKFLRGMTLGAIIGAVIAGSSYWTRRRRAANQPEAPQVKPAGTILDAASRETPDAR